jgi:Domain of unknown function (DUF6484)
MADQTGQSIAGEKRRRVSRSKALPDAVRGVLVAISPDGDPMVDYCANTTGAPIAASSLVAVRRADIGRETLLLYEDGDAARPIIIGLIQQPASLELEPVNREPIDVTLDGQRVTLSAAEEIVLRCGDASITLTRSGKILIRGAYLLSRSSGPNRIKGASIHLN